MPIKPTLTVGQIGYKFMGKAHSNAYRQAQAFFDLPCRLRMKTLCGRDPEWVARSAERFGWEGCETDWRRVIDDPEIDIVDITAPSDAHKEIAIAAAQAGKHIFCEKPLALNLADAREIERAARTAGVTCQIGFNYRFAPAVALAKQIIESGKLGRIFHVRGYFLQDWLIDPMSPKVWRLDKKVCGSGSLGDLGAHVIDATRYLIGEFDSVAAMSKTFVTERPLAEKMEGLSARAGADAPMSPVDVDDGTVFVADFKCGALGTFEATRFAAGHKNDMSFEINGEHGSVKFFFERMNELQYYSAHDEEGLQGFRLIQASEGGHPYMQAWWPTGHVIGFEHTLVHEIYEFINAIVHKTPASPDFSDGVRCSQIMEAVELSCETGKRVAVDSL